MRLIFNADEVATVRKRFCDALAMGLTNDVSITLNFPRADLERAIKTGSDFAPELVFVWAGVPELGGSK